jgi:hypothetical protein
MDDEYSVKYKDWQLYSSSSVGVCSPTGSGIPFGQDYCGCPTTLKDDVSII